MDYLSIIANSYLVALSLGPTWIQNNQTQSIYLQPDVQKAYVTSGTPSSVTTGELFLGIQRPLPGPYMGQLGIIIETTGRAQPSGDIWEDADPNFDNESYQYDIQHTYLALKGQMLFPLYAYFQPYAGGSVGVAFNRASAFLAQPKLVAQIPSPAFSPHTQTAASYTLNLGAQQSWTDHWKTGVGYEFVNWGQSHLDPAAGQTINQGLTLSYLYAHQLQFTLSYVG